MDFWYRHIVFVAACVVLPLGLTFYVDSQAALSRSEDAGREAARAAPQALIPQLTLEGHRQVSSALTIAQKITDAKLMADMAKPARRSTAVRGMVSMLNDALPKGGFVWAVDEEGAIVARAGQAEVDESPEHVTGFPLFEETQSGFALDGLWRDGNALYLVGAAPLVSTGEAAGAVMVARPIDAEFINGLVTQIRGISLSIVVKDRVLASTLPAEMAQSIAGAAKSAEPVQGGRLTKPLESGMLPFTPLFIERNADGVAYSSVSVVAPGAADVRWVASVESVQMLRELASRQEILLAVMLAAVMLAVVFGLVMQRTYVKPIDVISDHLADLHTRRGIDRELNEHKVSGPFRRLVKLLNIMGNKLPAGNAASQSLSDLPASALQGAGGALPYGDDPYAAVSVAPPPRSASSLGSAPDAGLGGNGSLSDYGFDDPGLPLAGDPGLPLAGDPGLPLADPGLPMAGMDPGLPMAGMDPGLPLAADPGLPAASGDFGMPKSAAQIRGGVPRPASELRGTPVEYLSSEFPVGDFANPAPAPAPAPAPTMGPSVPGNDTIAGFMMPGGLAGLNGGGARTGGSAAGGAFGAAALPAVEDSRGETGNATMVAKVDDKLLEATRSPGSTGPSVIGGGGDKTMVGVIPPELLARAKAVTASEVPMTNSMPPGPAPGSLDDLDPEDRAHFQETYEAFLSMRTQCGESTSDLSLDRFAAKLRKNRGALMTKYNCKTVRFQVYAKDGKAALKATPIRAGEEMRA